MGATIVQEHGYLEARAERLDGAHIVFDKITVTGTEDLLMAAVLAEGETLMENCAGEPEVVDLAALLVAMGANIQGAGTATIRVQGVNKLPAPSTASILTASKRNISGGRRYQWGRHGGGQLPACASFRPRYQARGLWGAHHAHGFRFVARAQRRQSAGKRYLHRRVSRLSY